MASSHKVEMFSGKGDVNAFLVKIDLYNKLKKYTGEDAAVLLGSRLEEPAFNVYLRMLEEDRKDIEKIKAELKKQYEVGNRDREEALMLLSAAQRKEDETAQDYAFRIGELVKLAYPSFSVANKAVHEKDAFVRGHHPDMQMKLKTLENFATLDMKGILDNTVRLEVAGVKSVSKKFKEEINTVDEDAPVGNRQLYERLDGLEEAIAKLSVATSSANSRSNRRKPPASSSTSKKCRNCDETGHIVRQCPKRFCQSCGKSGHDSWDKACPKYS